MTVPEPSVCSLCGGDGELAVVALDGDEFNVDRYLPCPSCTCVICGQRTAAIGGECGDCWTDEDTAAVRRADR